MHRDILLGMTVGALVGVLFIVIAVCDVTRKYHKAAIERGFAQYCPANGEWAWKGECE